MAEREAWVVDRLTLDPKVFDGAYGWILESRELGSNEVYQLAHLFFYSSWQSCGYFDRPVKKDDIWVCAFHSGFPPVDGFDVIVDAKTGFAWQEGQTEKIDLLKLIRFIEQKRKTAEPGATDNPDDAQRLRENH